MAYDEDEQIARIKTWWSENWKSLAAGVVVGLGGLLAWNGWQDHQAERASNAAGVLSELVAHLDAGDVDAATAAGETLMSDYAGTPYETTARLRLAAAQVQAGALDAAAALLEAARDAEDEALGTLATIRLARLRWAQDDGDAALALLAGDKGPFTPLAEELKGDILVSRGERKPAFEAYSRALTRASDAQSDLLQQKLADLADVADVALGAPAAEAPGLAPGAGPQQGGDGSAGASTSPDAAGDTAPADGAAADA